MKIYGNLVDIHKRDIYPACISIRNGKIVKIDKAKTIPDLYILPGLIDAHIHVESSMITPGAFAGAALKHGTIGVVADPHEIANILGIRGINFMIRDGLTVPMKFWFGASPCVPATDFETNGATLTHIEIEKLLKRKEIKYLAEVMNFPGVIYNDEELHCKLKLAKRLGKPIDGHAPGLSGVMLQKYVSSGISTDHECSTLIEAEEKMSLGMNILIREGSAARNLNSLKTLFLSHPEMIMLCSDDLHPEMLLHRHINKLVAELISGGFDIFDIIRSATLNPVNHYNLETGLLKEGDYADFILVKNLKEMDVLETWINGIKVFDNGKLNFTYSPGRAINKFKCNQIHENNIRVISKNTKMRVIEAFDGELLTKEIFLDCTKNEIIKPDLPKDILKIVVKDRYNDTAPVTGFIKGFGLKKGAFASSIAHDSHNLISIGTNDSDIVKCINEIVKMKGGLVVSCEGKIESLQLNIGGIMTTRSCADVAYDYEKLNALVKSLGCTMTAPFMTLSFMALLVIPDLKISDRGLFDVKKFELVSLFDE